VRNVLDDCVVHWSATFWGPPRAVWSVAGSMVWPMACWRAGGVGKFLARSMACWK